MRILSGHSILANCIDELSIMTIESQPEACSELGHDGVKEK
jgi:hypothetical protein